MEKCAPVLFITFNRPATTKQVLAEIKKARPEKLYWACDGPRRGRSDEKMIEEVRSLVQEIDWPCELRTRFIEKNLGCRNAVSSAITWFFDNEPFGIILEDDCLPAESFFPYASELLTKYEDEHRIMHINGSKFLNENVKKESASYYFSQLQSIWGWASWARAWKSYHVDIPDWPEVRKSKAIRASFPNKWIGMQVEENLDKIFYENFNTWDFQWTYAIAKNKGLSIIPMVNQISNIGFDGNATHTTKSNARANLPTYQLEFPLSHPVIIQADKKRDTQHYMQHMRRGIRWRLKKMLNQRKVSAYLTDSLPDYQ